MKSLTELFIKRKIAAYNRIKIKSYDIVQGKIGIECSEEMEFPIDGTYKVAENRFYPKDVKTGIDFITNQKIELK